MLEPLLARLQADRLLRWSVFATLPFLWLAVALLNPWVLLVLPLAYLALERAMAYGILVREEPAADPDDF